MSEATYWISLQRWAFNLLVIVLIVRESRILILQYLQIPPQIMMQKNCLKDTY